MSGRAWGLSVLIVISVTQHHNFEAQNIDAASKDIGNFHLWDRQQARHGTGTTPYFLGNHQRWKCKKRKSLGFHSKKKSRGRRKCPRKQKLEVTKKGMGKDMETFSKGGSFFSQGRAPPPNWSYPELPQWYKLAPICFNGSHQSPIDIYGSFIKPTKMGKVEFTTGYGTDIIGTWANNGHTLVFTPRPDQAPLQIRGKALPLMQGFNLRQDYNFNHLLFHWGSEPGLGSEHAISDGPSYSMELQMVHVSTAYKSFDEALEHPDGLAIISILITEAPSNRINSAFSALDLQAERLHVPGQSAVITLNLRKILDSVPNLDHYYSYEGSLTYPKCNEVVTWIVMAEPAELHTSQVERFRLVKGINGKWMWNNFRPPRPPDRTIKKNIF